MVKIRSPNDGKAIWKPGIGEIAKVSRGIAPGPQRWGLQHPIWTPSCNVQRADACWVMAYSHKTQSFIKNRGQQKCLDKSLQCMAHKSIFNLYSVEVFLEYNPPCNDLLLVIHLIDKIWFFLFNFKISNRRHLIMCATSISSCITKVSPVRVLLTKRFSFRDKLEAYTFYHSILKTRAFQHVNHPILSLQMVHHWNKDCLWYVINS